MNKFNPFSEVFQQKYKPHAHVLRTPLSKKLKDTFYIFTGKFGALTQYKLTGIFDYLTFFLTPGHMALFQIKPRKPIHALVLGMSYLLQTILLPLRYLFGAVLTAVVSPLVALTHLFSRIKGNKLIQKTKTLTSTKNETLAQLLSKERSTLEDYHCQFAILSNPNGKPVLVLSKTAKGENDHHDSKHDEFIVDLQNISAAQKAAVRALVELDFGGLTQFLSERGLMHYFMKHLDKNFDQTLAGYAEDKIIFHFTPTTAKTTDQFLRQLIHSVEAKAPFNVRILEDYLADASVRAFTKKVKKSPYLKYIEDLKKIARGESNVYEIGIAYAEQNTPESRRVADFFLSSIGEYDDAYQNASFIRATIALTEKDFTKAERLWNQLYQTSNTAQHLRTAIDVCKRNTDLSPSKLPDTVKSTPEERKSEFFKIDVETLIQRLQQEKHPLWHASRKAKKIAALQDLSSKVQQKMSPKDAISALKSSTTYDKAIEAGHKSRVSDLFKAYS